MKEKAISRGKWAGSGGPKGGAIITDVVDWEVRPGERGSRNHTYVPLWMHAWHLPLATRNCAIKQQRLLLCA